MWRALALLVIAVTSLAGPTRVAAQAPTMCVDQTDRGLFACWRDQVTQVVTLGAGTVDDGAMWNDRAGRDALARRMDEVRAITSRLSPDFAAEQSTTIQPTNQQLATLAAALRTGRRDTATDALDNLRAYRRDLVADRPVAVDWPARPFEVVDSEPLPYTATAIQRLQSSCAAEAYALGWQAESSQTPESYLRDYWWPWIGQSAGEGPTPTTLALSCAGLYARAQELARTSGLQAVQTQGLIGQRPPPPPAGTLRDLALRRYLEMLDGAVRFTGGDQQEYVPGLKRLLPNSFECYYPVARLLTGASTSILAPRACEVLFDDLNSRANCMSDASAVIGCLKGLWQDRFRMVSNWEVTPYPQLHAQLLASLSLLNQAAETVDASQSATVPVGRRLGLVRDARVLVELADEQFCAAIYQFDGSICDRSY